MRHEAVRCGVILLAMLPLWAGCSGPPKVNDQDVQKLLYPQFLEMLEAEGKHQPILVDVRTRARFAQGHIKGAINIPVVELSADHPRLSRKRPIIVYGDGFNAAIGRDDMLSTVAAKKLIACGYDLDRVFDFRGGLNYWQKQGGKLTRN